MAFEIPKPSPYWDPGQIVEPDYMSLDELGLNPTVDIPAPAVNTHPAEQIIRKTSDRDPDQGLGTSTRTRDMTNNFGYINKPGWMGATAALPGALGLGAKAVNVGMNVNNQQAVADARETLGLPEQSTFDQAKGFVKDNKGLVGNVEINKQNYPVGFEAEDPTGRTTLTPNEARTRSLTLGGMTEVAPPAQEKSKVGSFFDNLFDEASNTLQDIFKDDTPTATHEMAMQPGKFPVTPEAPENGATPSNSAGPWGAQGNGLARGGGYDGTSYSGQNKGLDSPSEGGSRFGGSGLGTPSNSDKDKDRSV